MAELTSANVSYRIDLDGAFARSELDGLFLAADKEHCEVGVRVSHNVPDCRSRSLVKGVAGGEATGAFQGLVYVAPGAQRTDAQQTSRNVELSTGARIVAKPQLEIYADDVKCTHGATVRADGRRGDPLHAAARPERTTGTAVADGGIRRGDRGALCRRTALRGTLSEDRGETRTDVGMFDVEKIRADFPLLSTEVYGRPLVYLDSGATAQKPRCVIDTVDYLHRELNANIHRGVHRLAEEATERYEAARDRIRAFIGAAHREEVIFTAGATASLNTVAYAWGDTFLRAGDNIVVSEMEHHSNLVPWQAVALRKGAELRMLPFDDAGRLMTERLDGLIDGRTRMVAVTQASNTLGTRPDLRPIVEAAHAVGALVCGGRLPGHRARRRGCRGAGVRLLCLFGPQALRPDRYRRALRAARTARGDASVPRRRRHGRSGDRSRGRPMRRFR